MSKSSTDVVSSDVSRLIRIPILSIGLELVFWLATLSKKFLFNFLPSIRVLLCYTGNLFGFLGRSIGEHCTDVED